MSQSPEIWFSESANQDISWLAPVLLQLAEMPKTYESFVVIDQFSNSNILKANHSDASVNIMFTLEI
jgi:hypothetical protein